MSRAFSNNTKGVLWALLGAAMFAVEAAMIKTAARDYHVLQILFFRQLVVLLSSVPAIATSFPGSLQTHYPITHAYRLAGAFIALSCGMWAVAVLPLTTAITLGFAKVFFVAMLALYFLNESVGIHRVGAVIAGFVGVVIVMRPGIDGLNNLHVLIPIVAALGAAVATIAVRKLSQTESTATLLVYQALFVGALAGIPLFWLWQTPDLKGLLILLAMATLATAGQWIAVKALRLGEASVVGHVQYVQLIYAAVLGFALFGEIPDSYTIAGAAIIIGSSIYLLHRETLSA